MPADHQGPAGRRPNIAQPGKSLCENAGLCAGAGAHCRSLGSPGFPAELGGAGKLHAPFFTERRTRCRVQCRVAGNPGALGMTKGQGSASIDGWLLNRPDQNAALLAARLFSNRTWKRHLPPFVIPSAAEGSAVRPGSRTKAGVLTRTGKGLGIDADCLSTVGAALYRCATGRV